MEQSYEQVKYGQNNDTLMIWQAILSVCQQAPGEQMDVSSNFGTTFAKAPSCTARGWIRSKTPTVARNGRLVRLARWPRNAL